MSHSKISTRNPSQKRYADSKRWITNKLRKITKSNGSEAAEKWQKEFGSR